MPRVNDKKVWEDNHLKDGMYLYLEKTNVEKGLLLIPVRIWLEDEVQNNYFVGLKIGTVDVLVNCVRVWLKEVVDMTEHDPFYSIVPTLTDNVKRNTEKISLG